MIRRLFVFPTALSGTIYGARRPPIIRGVKCSPRVPRHKRNLSVEAFVVPCTASEQADRKGVAACERLRPLF